MVQSDTLSRKIIISSDINNVIAEEVISRILEINSVDEQMSVVSTYNPEPIEIFINSGGGNASDGFAIIGAMEMSTTPIITYALGMVASMALGIFVSGDIKIAHRYARLMYHSVSFGVVGHIKNHEDRYQEFNYIQNMYDDLFKKSNITREQMKTIREGKSDYFFSGKEAVELGIADNVFLKPEKRIKLLDESELDESEGEEEVEE